MKKRNVREKELESYLRRQVEKLGGRCYKWVSPGNDGVPDRIVFFPGGQVFFIEMKAPGGELRPSQRIQHPRLEALGNKVYVFSSRKQIDAFLEDK